MPSKSDVVRAVTIRLPVPLLTAAKRLAARRRLSFNALVRLAIEKVVADERQELLRASYDALASDNADVDVEGYLRAQREVVRRG